MSFSGGGAAHLSGLPDGTTCRLAKRSASDETAEQVAESATVVGKDDLGAKALRPSGRCLRQRSLASLESNLGRSFSSFPVGWQNIEYRRVIGLRCFLRRWWWGRIRTFEVDDGRFTVCSLWPLGNPTGLDGADYRNRTGDLLITSQLLYLLS